MFDPITAISYPRCLRRHLILQGKRPDAYDLTRLVNPRPDKITLIFDQSVIRGSERAHITRKISELHRQAIFGTAYESHACFLLVSKDRELVDKARKHLIHESRLPEKRFLPVPGE